MVIFNSKLLNYQRVLLDYLIPISWDDYSIMMVSNGL